MKIKIVSIVCFLCLGWIVIAQANVLSDYRGFWSNQKKIDLKAILHLTDDELPFIRNEIYARYGRSFVTTRIRNHFLNQSWYKEVPDFDESWVTALDTQNAQLLLNIERPRLNLESSKKALIKNMEYRETGSDGILVINGYNKAEYSDSEYMRKVYGNVFYRKYDTYVIWGDWIVLYSEIDRTRTATVTTIICLRLDHENAKILEIQQHKVSEALLNTFLANRGV